MDKRTGLWAAIMVGLLLTVSGAVRAGEIARPHDEALNLPAAWRDVTAQERLVAKRAAEVDAARVLAERIYGLQIDAQTCVGDLAYVDDVINGALQAEIKGVRTTEVTYKEDLSVQVVREITIRQIIETIKRNIKEEQTRLGIKREEVENIARHTEDKVLAAMGNGAVPESHGQRRILAKRAAEMDLYRRLAERVLGTKLTADTTVKDLVLGSDVITAAVAGSLAGVTLTDIAYHEDDSCSVTGKLVLRTIIERTEWAYKQEGKGRRVISEEQWLKVARRENQDIVIEETGEGAPRPEDAAAEQNDGRPFCTERIVIGWVVGADIGELEQTAPDEEKEAPGAEEMPPGAEKEKAGELPGTTEAYRPAGAATQEKVAEYAQRMKRSKELVAQAKEMIAGKSSASLDEAIATLEAALREWDQAEARKLLKEARALRATMKDIIAVVDFQVLGDVNVKDVGQIVPRLLLSEFAGKFELFSRTQLEASLREKNLAVTDLMTPDAAMKYGKLLRVNRLVVGEVMEEGGTYHIAAQLLEPGRSGLHNPRRVSGASYRNVSDQIPLLGKLISMTDEEYTKWQDENYPKLMAEAKEHVGAGRWQQALDSYQQAFAIRPSAEAREGVALATQRIEEERQKKAAYDAAVKAAEQALNANDYTKAAEQVQTALGLFPAGAEAIAIRDKLVPTLTVIAVLDGRELAGAKIRINGEDQTKTTPATLTLEKGHQYDIAVTLPAQGGKVYTTARHSIRTDQPGPLTFRAQIEELKMRVPAGCAAAPGTTAEPYTNTGWAKEIIVTTNGANMPMVFIPAGEFTMGSPAGEEGRNAGDPELGLDTDEGPQHRVRITKPFYLGKYEVTQEQWQQVMGNNPSHFKGAKNPVEMVSWNDCQEFCRKAGLRLPTEAEWEYACRAGTTTRFCSGDAEASLDAVAWYGANSGKQTHAVGGKRPNAWGLYDMHGNVWEWCQDTWHWDYNDAPTDGSAWEGGGDQARVRRGGAWIYFPRDVRSAIRYWIEPTVRLNVNGFRVARTLE